MPPKKRQALLRDDDEDTEYAPSISSKVVVSKQTGRSSTRLRGRRRTSQWEAADTPARARAVSPAHAEGRSGMVDILLDRISELERQDDPIADDCASSYRHKS